MRVTVWADSPRSVCFICLGKGEYRRITGCQSGCGWVSFKFLSRKNRVAWYFSAKYRLPKKALGFGQCIGNLYFLWEKNLIFYKFYIDKEHLHQIYFLFQTTYSAFIQLLPVLVIVIISVITQLLATNPPYSLFYKS